MRNHPDFSYKKLTYGLRKAKENADSLLQQKAAMDKEQKELEEAGNAKDAVLQKKLKTIGNYVHDSVPISDNEVGSLLCITSSRILKADRIITS